MSHKLTMILLLIIAVVATFWGIQSSDPEFKYYLIGLFLLIGTITFFIQNKHYRKSKKKAVLFGVFYVALIILLTYFFNVKSKEIADRLLKERGIKEVK